MADYLEYDLANVGDIKHTVRYTVQDSVTYQVRVICYFECKHNGRAGTVDGFSSGYRVLDYETMLQEAINQAYANLENCSPAKFYPKYVSIIEYRPQAKYLDESIKKKQSYLEIRSKYGKEAITKTEYGILNKLLVNQPLTKDQIAKAYKIQKKYDKALKRVSSSLGTKKDYDNAVKSLEKAKEKAQKEKKK